MPGTQICDRCKRKARHTIVSKFNTQAICDDCKTRECCHPSYPVADLTEVQQMLRGDRNYVGIGLPESLAAGSAIKTVPELLGEIRCELYNPNHGLLALVAHMMQGVPLCVPERRGQCTEQCAGRSQIAECIASMKDEDLTVDAARIYNAAMLPGRREAFVPLAHYCPADAQEEGDEPVDPENVFRYFAEHNTHACRLSIVRAGQGYGILAVREYGNEFCKEHHMLTRASMHLHLRRVAINLAAEPALAGFPVSIGSDAQEPSIEQLAVFFPYPTPTHLISEGLNGFERVLRQR